MNDNRHIRITRVWADVSIQMIMADYHQKSDRVLIFQHGPDNGAARDHIHIFCFGLKTNQDTIRETLRKYVPGKMDLCVKSKAGRKNDIELTDQGAYNYGSRDGVLKPVWSKGYTDQELDELYKCAEHLRVEKQKNNESKVIYAVQEVVKVDRVYLRLMEEAHHHIPEDYRKTMTLTEWKRWVVMNYLRAGKPAPRTADGNRYAYSLMMSYKYDLINDPMGCPLEALTTDYN